MNCMMDDCKVVKYWDMFGGLIIFIFERFVFDVDIKIFVDRLEECLLLYIWIYLLGNLFFFFNLLFLINIFFSFEKLIFFCVNVFCVFFLYLNKKWMLLKEIYR